MTVRPKVWRLCSASASLAVAACLLLSAPLSAQDAKPRAAFKGLAESIAFSPDGKTLASGSDDKAINFWDLATGKITNTIKDDDLYHWRSIAFSPDGKTLATGGVFNKVKLWDVGARKGTLLLDDRSQCPEPKVVFSRDGKMLASGGMCRREIRLWDVAGAKLIAKLEGHDAYGPQAMAFTPDGKTLMSIGRDSTLRRWDVTTGRNTGTLVIADDVRVAAFSPDGKTLATGGRDLLTNEGDRTVVLERGEFKLWDVATGKEQATLTGHTGQVKCAVFSPDGKTLASGGGDKSIKLWDVATRKEIATLKGHTGSISSLAFSPDGNTLASGGQDTINLWDAGRGTVKLDLTGSLKPGKLVTINAQILYPPLGQSLTLELPAGLERVEGKVVQPVPPVDASGNALVQWRVRAVKPGQFEVRVGSSTGATVAKRIEVNAGDAKPKDVHPGYPPTMLLASASEQDGKVVIQMSRPGPVPPPVDPKIKEGDRFETEWVPLRTVTLGDKVHAFGVDGKALDAKAVLKALAKPTGVVVFMRSYTNDPITPPPFYRAMLREGTIILVANPGDLYHPKP